MIKFKKIRIDGSGEKGEKLILKLVIKNHTIEFFDVLPDTDTIYLLSSYLEVFDPKISMIIPQLLNSNDLETSLSIMKKTWNIEKINIIEENLEIKYNNNIFYFPIISKSSGNLGTLIFKGNINPKFILNFLSISNSITSILEGLILKSRISELLNNTLDALSETLAKKTKIDKKILRKIQEEIVRLGKNFGYTEDILKISAKIYDIGKIGIPDYILSKKDLTMKENEILNKHIEIGYEILNKLENLPKEILDVVLYHHEKLDGSGPLKLKNVPLLSQIVGISIEVIENKTPIETLYGKFDEKLIEEMKKRYG